MDSNQNLTANKIQVKLRNIPEKWQNDECAIFFAYFGNVISFTRSATNKSNAIVEYSYDWYYTYGLSIVISYFINFYFVNYILSQPKIVFLIQFRYTTRALNRMRKYSWTQPTLAIYGEMKNFWTICWIFQLAMVKKSMKNIYKLIWGTFFLNCLFSLVVIR